MATMNPILRLRQAFRSLGAEVGQADEATDAISDYGYSRRESDLRFERMMAEIRAQSAEMREYMSNLRNQMLLGTLLIVGLAVTVLSIVIAVLD